MKRTLRSLMALVISGMLLITGCSNSTQIQFENESNSGYTENGFSALTIKVSSTPSYGERTIFPDDWEPGLMKKLVYQLKAVPTDIHANPTQKDPASKGYNFSYEQILAGQAVVELDPIAWTFTLDAYQPLADQPLEPDTAKKVLTDKSGSIDLAEGGTMIEFNLEPVRDSETATGQLDINFYFFKEDGLESIDVTMTKADGAPLTLKPADKNITGLVAGDGGTVEYNGDPLHRRFQYTGDKVGVGIQMLTATFKNKDGKEILKYQEKVVIDGGNLSKKEIHIPKGSYDRAPDKPTNVTAVATYAGDSPADPLDVKDPLLTVSTAKNIYAREADDADTALANDRYTLKIDWQDNAFNEEYYMIKFTTMRPEKADQKGVGTVSIEYDSSLTPKITEAGGQNYVKVVTGDLAPSSESITLSLPTGLFCQDIEVVAHNAIGDTASDKIANSASYDIPGTPDPTNVPKANPIGMFTVAYNLDDPSAIPHNAVITYNISGGKTVKPYFVVAYNFGDNSDSIKQKGEAIVYPFVFHDKYNFSGWYFTGPDGAEPTTSVKLEKINDASLVSGATYDYQNQNIEVKGSWTTTVGVKVKFPKYDGLKELQVVNQLMGEVLELGNAEGSIGIPTESQDKVTGLTYTIYRPMSGEETAEQKLTTVTVEDGGNSATLKPTPISGVSYDSATKCIKITPTELLTQAKCVGGIYRIYISYTYEDTGKTGMTVPIDGNLYVRISNDAKN